MSRVADLAERAMAERAGLATIFDLKLNYVAEPGGEEELSATAGIVHEGRRTIVTECRIEAPGGRLVATASATFVRGEELEH